MCMEETNVTRTVEFKLILTAEQRRGIDAYADEYKKAVNFALNRIIALRKGYEYIPKKNQYEAKCVICKNKETICWGGCAELCECCYKQTLGDSHIRKMIYPARGRLVEHRNNILNVSRINKSIMPLAIDHAVSILKSIESNKRRYKNKLEFKKEYVKHLGDVLLNNKIVVDEDIAVDGVIYKKGDEIFARKTIPAKGGQKIDRWVHILNLVRKPRTEKDLQKTFNLSKRDIRKLEKAVEAKPHFHNATTIHLHKSSLYHFKEHLVENKVTITLDKRYVMELYGTNTKNPRSRRWFEENVVDILNHDVTYATLVIKDNGYYLQYPVTTKHKIEQPNSTYNAVGVDRGINNIAVYARLCHHQGKPYDIGFESGKEVIHKKRQKDEYRKKLTGKRDRLNKMRKTGDKGARISDYLLQTISYKIVQTAKRNMPCVIVLEDLDITDKKTKKNVPKKIEKKLNYLLNNFSYGKLQGYIVNKAFKENIPVVYVPAPYTSKKCSKCGYVSDGNRKGSDFKCGDCGSMLNADLNAAMNIAGDYYRLLSQHDLEPRYKGVGKRKKFNGFYFPLPTFIKKES